MKAPQWPVPAAKPLTLDSLAASLGAIVGEQPTRFDSREGEPFPRTCKAFRDMVLAIHDDAEAYTPPEQMGFMMALDMIETIFQVRAQRGRRGLK